MRVHGLPITFPRLIAWCFPAYVGFISAGSWLVMLAAEFLESRVATQDILETLSLIVSLNL